MSKIFVIAGTSGSGKTTIANILLENFSNLKKVITCTTRKNRGNEIDDVDYHFVTKEKFNDFIKNEELVEYEEYGGNLYGSLKSEVNDLLKQNNNVLFVVEPKGALTIKEKFENVITIFIKAPSLDELRKRFSTRGDSQEKIEQRIKLVKRDLSFENKFDYSVINDDLDLAVNEIKKLIENLSN